MAVFLERDGNVLFAVCQQLLHCIKTTVRLKLAGEI